MERRKPLRLKGYDYSQNNAYFVTVCVRDRSCIFWRPDAQNGRTMFAPTPVDALSDVGLMVDACVRSIPMVYAHIQAAHYAIMPNHVHLLLLFDDAFVGAVTDRPPTDLSRVIKQFKGAASKKAGTPLWQKGFYETVVRSERQLLDIWQYITENPHKWQDDEYFA